jgi:hypothetical protein
MSGADHDEVVGPPVPVHVLSNQLRVRDAVRVDEDKHLGCGVGSTQVARGSGSVALVLLAQEGNLETLGDFSNNGTDILVRSIIGDNDFDELGWICLSDKTAESVTEQLDTVIHRDDDGYFRLGP